MDAAASFRKFSRAKSELTGKKLPVLSDLTSVTSKAPQKSKESRAQEVIIDSVKTKSADPASSDLTELNCDAPSTPQRNTQSRVQELLSDTGSLPSLQQLTNLAHITVREQAFDSSFTSTCTQDSVSPDRMMSADRFSRRMAFQQQKRNKRFEENISRTLPESHRGEGRRHITKLLAMIGSSVSIVQGNDFYVTDGVVHQVKLRKYCYLMKCPCCTDCKHNVKYGKFPGLICLFPKAVHIVKQFRISLQKPKSLDIRNQFAARWRDRKFRFCSYGDAPEKCKLWFRK